MKVLVVQTKEIGDVLFSTAICNTLKLNDPQGRVDYLIMDYCRGMADGNPNIDTIIPVEHARKDNWFYLLGLMRRLRAERYDVLVNIQGQIMGLLPCLLAGIPRRIGFDRFGWNIPLTDRVKFREATENEGNGWIVDDRFALLKPLGLTQQDRSYRIWLSEEECAAGAARLASAGIDPYLPLVLFGVNSRSAYKVWPAEFYGALMDTLIEDHDAQILLYWGPGEKQYNRSVRDHVAPANRARVFADLETGSIRDLMALFTHADLFVGGDTGPRHMAQGLDVPTFGIAAPTGDKYIWNPWNNPRFRAIDLQDALGIDDREYGLLRAGIVRGKNDMEWFRKVTPEFARRELERMIAEEGLLKP